MNYLPLEMLDTFWVFYLTNNCLCWKECREWQKPSIERVKTKEDF